VFQLAFANRPLANMLIEWPVLMAAKNGDEIGGPAEVQSRHALDCSTREPWPWRVGGPGPQ